MGGLEGPSGSSMPISASSFLRLSHQAWMVWVGIFQKAEASA